MFTIEHATLTDVGVRRSHNQDAHAVVLGRPEDSGRVGHVFVVADGMGGHAVGEMASAMAVSVIPHLYQKHASQGPAKALRIAFREANAAIHERGTKNPEFRDMGTTTTALVLREDGAWIGHVGDSRAYRIRDGRVEQLSFDHSLVWELARRKHVSPSQIQDVPNNVIVRSLGPAATVEVDVEGPHPFRTGDVFVICSDGLSGQVSDQELGAAASLLPPAEACRFLVDLANLHGGPDNITVAIVRVVEGASAGQAPPPRPPWYRRIPWPIGVLSLGVLFAAAATGLIYHQQTDLGELLFGLSALTLIAGIASLVIYHRREQQRLEMEEPEEPVHRRVYRHAPCSVDGPLLEKLARLEARLVHCAHERHWEVDWATYQRHHAAAKRARMAQDFETQFREMARALRPLVEALAKVRHKEEAFDPQWEPESPPDAGQS